MNVLFQKDVTFENGVNTLKIENVYPSLIDVHISSSNQHKMIMSMRMSSDYKSTDAVVTLIPSICQDEKTCPMNTKYDTQDKTLIVPGIPGVFSMKYSPATNSPVTMMQSPGYTPFSSPTMTSPSSVKTYAMIKSVTPYSNFITVEYAIFNAVNAKITLMDKTKNSIIQTFKGDSNMSAPVARVDNRRTFNNLPNGIYTVQIVPYVESNTEGVMVESSEVRIGSDVNSSASSQMPMAGYTPFPESKSPLPAPPKNSKPAAAVQKPRGNLSTQSQTPMSMTPLR